MGPASQGTTVAEQAGCGDIYVTRTENNQILIMGGKGGGCMSCIMETIGRLMTVALRHGTPMEALTHTLQGIGCQHHVPKIGQRSCPDAVAQAILYKPE